LLTLLAWQLELIDIKTGQLALDETEQTTLIATAPCRFRKRISVPNRSNACIMRPETRSGRIHSMGYLKATKTNIK
jgi:hypothetical protein